MVDEHRLDGATVVGFVGLGTIHEIADFLALADAQIRRCVEGAALLYERLDDFEPQRLGEVAQFSQRRLELDITHRRQLDGRHDGGTEFLFDLRGHAKWASSKLARSECTRLSNSRPH